MSLSKAFLIPLEGENANQRIECLFNPNELSLSKSNQWSAGPNGAKDSPNREFGGGQPISLRVQLFFDTQGLPPERRRSLDVREYTDPIWKLMLVDKSLTNDTTKNGRPPKVRFQWGLMTFFVGVITSISQQFSLFLPDGLPVRATLDLTLEQATNESELPMQNPSSAGKGGEQVWMVKDGDTLAWIAYKALGDAGKWRRIAEANGLTKVRDLVAGQPLIIPVD
ncbi:CIS tube protein [Calidithermus roseus]|uniref:Uncharacterized protein n=1 Tax=Calidithermus roseus TaxID=1644118 RepID=A0A399EQB5_9DEIN|nr:LysM peptidoglycan-binding domain-containing protein [Calidithermus roseus]RIH85229.1 hypothetical protein Mrose_02287 [Calidithermus roseus]